MQYIYRQNEGWAWKQGIPKSKKHRLQINYNKQNPKPGETCPFQFYEFFMRSTADAVFFIFITDNMSSKM